MPAYSRPHSYTLNRQHPLADVAWLVVGDARQQAEIVGGELSSLGSTGSYGYGKLGKSLVSADDTNGGVSWNFPARLRDNFRDCSMAWFGELTSQASYGKLFCVPWFDNGTWNTPYVSLEFARDGALDTGRFDFANSSGVNVSVSSSSGYLDTSGALRLYGVTRSGADVTFWRDGQVYSEHAAAVGTDPVNWNLFAPLHLMNRTFLNPGEGSTGAVALAAIWRRPLSAGEWSLLYRDPFSLFASSTLSVALKSTVFVAGGGRSRERGYGLTSGVGKYRTWQMQLRDRSLSQLVAHRYAFGDGDDNLARDDTLIERTLHPYLRM